MKWKLWILSFSFLAVASTPALAEYTYNGYNQYDAYSGAYTLGGNSLYNIAGLGGNLSNYYGNSYSPYSSSSSYPYSSGYGSCSSIYYSSCGASNNLGMSGYYNPYSMGSYGNGYNMYGSSYGSGYGSTYPSSSYNGYSPYTSSYYGSSNYNSYYSYYTPGTGYDYYYIPGSSYYNNQSSGYGGYSPYVSNYNYSPVNVTINYTGGTTTTSLGGCNGVTIPCGTDVIGTPTITPIPPVLVPPTTTTPSQNTIPTNPSRTRVPRGADALVHR